MPAWAERRDEGPLKLGVQGDVDPRVEDAVECHEPEEPLGAVIYRGKKHLLQNVLLAITSSRSEMTLPNFS